MSGSGATRRGKISLNCSLRPPPPDTTSGSHTPNTPEILNTIVSITSGLDPPATSSSIGGGSAAHLPNQQTCPPPSSAVMPPVPPPAFHTFPQHHSHHPLHPSPLTRPPPPLLASPQGRAPIPMLPSPGYSDTSSSCSSYLESPAQVN